jgi:hypothetical protein
MDPGQSQRKSLMWRGGKTTMLGETKKQGIKGQVHYNAICKIPSK